ncbi:MAG: AraC family transcriptional regulator [Spirochaetales bacterium]|nr:AraC family transcriptional regulator [Spirochaetales bacterium]
MVQSFGIAHCPPGWYVEEPLPPGYARLYYVKGGQAVYRDISGSLPLQEGSLYFFPTARSYSIRHNPGNPFFCVYLHLDVFPENLISLSEIHASEDPVLFALLETITECIGRKRDRLVSVLADALVEYCREEELVKPSKSTLTPLLEYISLNLHRDLSIEELGNKAGYNTQYFIRLFRKELGTTPYQYIISRRMEKAKTLLKTEMRISDISDQTGFGDVKSFSRSFRKNTGFSPSYYRTHPVQGP